MPFNYPKTSIHGLPLSIDRKIEKGPSPEEIQKKKFAEQHINPPAWAASMKSIDLVALPFCDVPFEHDFYEKIIIELYKRKLSYIKIFLLCLVVIGPLFWNSFFPYVKKIKVTTVLARWPLLFVLPAVIVMGVYYILITLKYDQIFLPVAVILVPGYFLIYFIMTVDTFMTWHRAYFKSRKYIRENICAPKKKKGKIKKVPAPKNKKQVEKKKKK
ncbi:MAG: hypothetical protein HQM16_03955 [Deltaproteobacteria bacterium]|nr:hypothetical protein [Deltaproteobacteria bacterium]